MINMIHCFSHQECLAEIKSKLEQHKNLLREHSKVQFNTNHVYINLKSGGKPVILKLQL